MTDNIPSSFNHLELLIDKGIEALRVALKRAKCHMATEDDFADAEEILESFEYYLPQMYKEYVRIVDAGIRLNAQSEEFQDILNELSAEGRLDEFSEVISKRFKNASMSNTFKIIMALAVANETPAE